MALDRLQVACLALLFSTQAHPVGFPELSVHRDTSLESLLSDKELRLLALYDKLQRVSLERRTLEAEHSDEINKNETHGENPEETIARLEAELVEAKAQRELKETVVELALITRPVLKTIHEAATNSPRERGLLPLLHRRDTLSLTHANLSHALQETLAELSEAEVAYRDVQQHNRELTAKLLDITEQRKRELRAQRGSEYAAAEKKLKETRVRWDIMRNVVQAIIVSSGVDWSRDERLRAVVLACGEEI